MLWAKDPLPFHFGLKFWILWVTFPQMLASPSPPGGLPRNRNSLLNSTHQGLLEEEKRRAQAEAEHFSRAWHVPSVWADEQTMCLDWAKRGGCLFGRHSA